MRVRTCVCERACGCCVCMRMSADMYVRVCVRAHKSVCVCVNMRERVCAWACVREILQVIMQSRRRGRPVDIEVFHDNQRRPGERPGVLLLRPCSI